jgi:hypothetical protein
VSDLASIHPHARAHTHKYVIPVVSHGNSFVNAPQCYVIRTLPFLFIILPFIPRFSKCYFFFLFATNPTLPRSNFRVSPFFPLPCLLHCISLILDIFTIIFCEMYTFLHLPFTSHFLSTDFLLYPCPNLVHSLSMWTKMEDVLHLSFLRCLVTNLRYTVGKASWKKPDTNRLPLLVVLVRARHEEFTLVRSKAVFSYNRKSCFSSSYFAAFCQWMA